MSLSKKCKNCAQCNELKKIEKIKRIKKLSSVEENFSPLPAKSWCGEKTFFSATSRMRWKNKFSPLKLLFLQIFTANFNAYLKFTGNVIKVSDRWRSGIRGCWHAGDERLKPVYGSFFFVRNLVTALKKKFTAKKRKSLTVFIAFNANYTLFFDQTSTRVVCMKGLQYVTRQSKNAVLKHHLKLRSSFKITSEKTSPGHFCLWKYPGRLKRSMILT